MAIYAFNDITPSLYVQAIKRRVIRPLFKLSILNEDETFKEDISEYLVMGSGSLSVSYKQGQRRSLSFELINEDGRFTPDGLNGIMWINTKLKLELGIELANGDEIWNPAGIFVLGNPQSVRQDAQRTISFQCYDKFALLDGTLGGTLNLVYIVKQGEKIIDVFRDTLFENNGNGYPIDSKELLFDSSLSDAKTEYELSKEPNESLGAILIELANSISADVYYNENGNLVVTSGIEDISNVNKPILWTYSDEEFEYLESSVNYNFTAVKNHVTVVGGNNNADAIYVGTAINTNPQSPTRVSIIGTKVAYIDDSNIFSESLAQQRAEYELNKLSILSNTITINSTFLINLDVNQCIRITDEYYNYFDTRFLIQSFNIPLSVDGVIDINCSNIASLPFYN